MRTAVAGFCRTVFGIILLLALALAPEAGARTRRAPVSWREFSGPVLKVIDGDSLVVRKGVDEIEIRLARLDAPELKQPGGTEAKAYLVEKLLGQTVLVRAKTLDTYGRLIAELTRGGRSVNEQIVAAGWAWWYRQGYPNERVMPGLERQARAEKRGVWREPSPTPPWAWRRAHPR